MASEEHRVPFSTICEDLNISPSQLREILSVFGDLVGLPPAAGPEPSGDDPLEEEPPWKGLLGDEDEGSGECGEGPVSEGLPAGSKEIIQRILELREEGTSEAEIRESILSPGESGAGTVIATRIDRLARELAQIERKRAEDRDRLLTALMKTHQEVRQLRNELAAKSTRSARKKGSFLSRLFGG